MPVTMTPYICICSRYNFCEPHPVLKVPLYHHFAEAGTKEEKECLRSSQVKPHTCHGLHAHCTAVIQAMAKRQLETMDNGHCKCAHTQENESAAPELDGPTTPVDPCAGAEEELPVPGLDGPATPVDPCADKELPAPGLDGPATPVDPHVDKELPAPGLDQMVAFADIQYEWRTHPIIDIETLTQSAILLLCAMDHGADHQESW
ncbi:hypothetical protein F5J12DRAFT_915714 [Pisolithus orientalis]|uniref:uncharacterized protein n=1 Tax=Pisolithus orientalis TaxID=936130 RepID=UPI00222422A0|nr:uncharacterized protein F5J12DRAFT_915714 [Pisolithus orientalis]KAI5990563.1 hypothetical protein F5J12DRAFT_915714 [Pisolithus orientalis]